MVQVALGEVMVVQVALPGVIVVQVALPGVIVAAVVQINHLIILHQGLVATVQHLKLISQAFHLPPGHLAHLPVMELMARLQQCTIM